ncbi:MAG: TRAP transporter substrate-binding protein [Deltaproteobacteria bacterium]|nr:TRAP transporter substrate-binding protein [Deltaproteobacteria bacterium]
MKKTALVLLIAVLALFMVPYGASAGDKIVRLKMPSAIPTKLPLMENLHWFAKQVELITNGSVLIKIYEPGALVPPFEIQEAVSAAQVEAGWSGTIYMSGKMPAASLFTSMPFGPNVTEFFGWYYFGNGTKLMQEMYDTNGFNVKVWPMLFIPTESGGWFNKKVESVEDFKGMRLRWPGLGGKVLSKLGASVSTIPGGEIFPALEKGALDGSEFSNPILDNALGFWKVAKYNYFPGWHQTCTAMEFMINKKVWAAMSPTQQAAIETAIMASNLRGVALVEAGVGKILKANKEERGVQNMLYSKATLLALRATWEEVAKEESAKDAFFKKVYDDLTAFMNDYQIWECHSYPALPMECDY